MDSMYQEFELSINAEIRNPRVGDRLHIGETMTIRANTMMEVLSMLGKFHDLAESLRAAKEKK